MTETSQCMRSLLLALTCLALGSTITPAVWAAEQSPDPVHASTEAYPSNPGPAVTTITPANAEPRLLLAPTPSEVVPRNADIIRTPAPSAAHNSLSTPVPAVSPAVAPDTARQPLSIDEVLAVAFQHNPDLQIAFSRVEKSRGGIDEAKSRSKPSVTAQGSTTWLGTGNAVTGQGSSFSPQVGASLVLPLDVSRQLRYGQDLATYQYQSQYLAMVSTAEQLVLSVKSAYFDVLRAAGQRAVAQAAVDNAQAQLTQTRAKFDAGTIPAFDVTSAEVNLANLQQQLLVADNQVRVAQTALNRVMGIDVNTPTQIRGVDIAVSTDTPDIPQQIQVAYARRPEMQMAQLGITQAKTSVDLQSSNRYPSISIAAGPTYNFNPPGLNEKFSWQVGLTASVPLSDGGQTRAKVRQAEADVQTAQETLSQTQLAVAESVRIAGLKVQEAAQRAQTTARAVSLAEEALNLARLRYAAGLAVLVEVTNAETQLTQARNNAVNALYDYAVASAQLQRATSTQPELAALQPTADAAATQR